MRNIEKEHKKTHQNIGLDFQCSEKSVVVSFCVSFEWLGKYIRFSGNIVTALVSRPNFHSFSVGSCHLQNSLEVVRLRIEMCHHSWTIASILLVRCNIAGNCSAHRSHQSTVNNRRKGNIVQVNIVLRYARLELRTWLTRMLYARAAAAVVKIDKNTFRSMALSTSTYTAFEYGRTECWKRPNHLNCHSNGLTVLSTIDPTYCW